jgi:hypothetical protein
MTQMPSRVDVCACVVVLVVLILVAYQYYHKNRYNEPFMTDNDYSMTNYRLARGDKIAHTPLVWNKPAYIDAPLIVPSLKALRFRDTKKNLHQMVAQSQQHIVRKCAKERPQDIKDVQSTLTDVNMLIRRNELVKQLAIYRANNMKKKYDDLVATVAGSKEKDSLKELLVMDCKMTVDNYLSSAFFDDKPLTILGTLRSWWAPKSFQISNFRQGRVFACKCGDEETTEYDETFNHSEHAGLIVKSEFPESFSTLHGTDIFANWRVYRSSRKNDDPKAQGNVKWYESGYDDSGREWEPPVFSTSGFFLTYSVDYRDARGELRVKPPDVIMKERWQETATEKDKAWKIWAGENRNKYVWFRYKERRY